MSAVFFLQMLFSAVELASFISAVDETKGMNGMNNTAVVRASTVLLPTYHFCKQSDNTAGKLLTIGDAFFECSWYWLSARQQKLFLLPIARAQQEFRMTGLGIVSCTLQIFTAVSTFFLDLCKLLSQFSKLFFFLFLSCSIHADHSNSLIIFFAPT